MHTQCPLSFFNLTCLIMTCREIANFKRWKQHHSGPSLLNQSVGKYQNLCSVSGSRRRCWIPVERVLKFNTQTQPGHDWESAECKWFNSTSKWLQELVWHKQPRREWGDVVLNDYNSECSPFWLRTQLLNMMLGGNWLEDVIFLLGVSQDRNLRVLSK